MAGRRKNKAVTDVAEGIGIDPNASPEQAALEEAAQTGAAAQAAAVDATTPPIDPEAQAPDMTEESPTPGESEGLPAEPTSGVEVVSPGGEPPVAPVREKLPAGEGVEERLNPTPAAPLAAETKKAAKDHAAAVRESRKVESPSLKRLGAMGKKLPGAEHIKIYKRDEKGKAHIIDSYDANDLAQSQSIGEFIANYLKPIYGPGEYPIVGVNAYGVEFDAGAIRVMSPKTQPVPQKETTINDMFSDFLQKDHERREREIAELRSLLTRRPQEKDPFDTLDRAVGLQEKLGGASKKEAEGTMAALITSMSAQTQGMLRMMMEQQNRSNEQLLTILTTMGGNKGSDPILATLVAGLLEDRKKGGDAPLPPPPPQKDPADELKTMAEIVNLLKPDNSKSDEFMKYLLAKADKETITTKEMLELIRGERGTDDFKRSFDNLGLMLTAMKTLKEHTDGGGPSSGFWDAMTSLVSNPSFSSAVGNAIRQRTADRMGAGASTAGALPGSQQHRLMSAGVQAQQEVQTLEQRVRAVQAKREALLRELVNEEEALDQAIAQAPRQHRPGVAQSSPQAPAGPVARAPSPKPQPHPQTASVAEEPEFVHVPPTAVAHAGVPTATPEQEAAAGRAVQRLGRVPQLPDNIGDMINALVLAADESELVEQTINMIFGLGAHNDWVPFADTVVGLIREGDKDNALAFLGEFFNTLAEMGLIDGQLAQNVNAAFDRHFQTIMQMAQEAADSEGEEGEEEEELEGELEGLEGEVEPQAQEQS